MSAPACFANSCSNLYLIYEKCTGKYGGRAYMDADMATCLCSNSINTLFPPCYSCVLTSTNLLDVTTPADFVLACYLVDRYYAPFTISIPTYSSYSIVTTIAPSSTTSASTTTSTSTTTSSSTGADPNGTSNPNPVINGDPSSSEINNSDKALTIGLGASLGAVVFFIMGTASAFFYFRKKNKHRNSASTNLATASNPTPA